ncbi:MAG: phosphoenolpyruvate carboxylase [Actinomycetota bacterium]
MTGAERIPEALRRQVRLLSTVLGRVIVECDGPGLLAEVERLRLATIALRRSPSPAHEREVVELVAALPIERASQVARAFTVYFQLVNVAEERHRVRELQERGRAPQPVHDSVEAAVEAARSAIGDEGLVELLGRLEVRPVLTSHPTEARRRSVVDALWRIAELVEGLDAGRLSRAAVGGIERRLAEEITVLWTTDPLRPKRPEPLDEVRATMALFDQTIFRVAPIVYRELDRALAPDPGGRPPVVRAFLRWGSWAGGDRDGNPHVTAAVTRRTMEVQSEHVLLGLEAAARRISRSLTAEAGRVPPSSDLCDVLRRAEREMTARASDLARRFPDSPHRRALLLAADRVAATRTGRAHPYPGPAPFLDDLRVIQDSLVEAGVSRLAFGEIQHLIWQAETFGFHSAELEIRQHALAQRAAVEELKRGASRDAPELDRLAEDPLPIPGDLSAATADALDTLREVSAIQWRFGVDACRRYVVSGARDQADLVAVHALARAAVPDGAIELDVVPLFETRADLEAATGILDRTLALPNMAARLERRDRRVEVMLGYSDSAKEIGMVSAALVLYRAEAALAAWARRRRIELTLVHGRGGAVGRGGGPTNRAVLAQAPGSVDGRLKVTEQGEVAFARYGDLAIARRHLEQLVHATIVASTVEADADPAWERFGETAQELAAAGEAAYRDLVTRDGFATFFARATPLDLIGELDIGSRPARRSGEPDLASLRAIPWVFAWSQTRANLPGWFGLGSGLAAIADRPGGPERLREMVAGWPFFAELLENAELSLAKGEPLIARRYLELGGRPELAARIERERELTERLVLAATGHGRPLAGRPLLRHVIDLRNPYVDALSFLQLRALAELRGEPGEAPGPDRRHARELALITLKGVSAGLQNTG